MFFYANTIKTGQKNAILWRTCQTTFKKAEFLEFGLPSKNANLATLTQAADLDCPITNHNKPVTQSVPLGLKLS